MKNKYKYTKKRKNNFAKRTRSNFKKGGGPSNLVVRPPPNLGSNIAMLSSALAQGLNNLASSAIKTGAKYLMPNVDVNKPVSQVLQESKDELKNVVNVLQSPVGDELVQEASVIGEKLVDAVEKPFEEIGDKGMAYMQKQIPVVEDMAKTTLFGMPVIGSAAAAAEDAFDVIQSVENTVATGADMLQSGEKMVSNLQKPMDDASQLYGKYQNALNNPLPLNQSLNQNIKKYQNVGKMIGGRTRKSQSDFFAPFTGNSQILRIAIAGGSRTRRYRNRIRYL